MLNTIKAIMREGRIELLEQVDIPEGTEVLVTVLSDEAEFWRRASESSLASVWDNEEDDIYEQLLKMSETKNHYRVLKNALQVKCGAQIFRHFQLAEFSHSLSQR